MSWVHFVFCDALKIRSRHLAYATVGVYRTPLGRFPMVDISAVGADWRRKRSALETYRERAVLRCIVRYWHRLGCRAIELGNTAPGGGDIHRRYGSPRERFTGLA